MRRSILQIAALTGLLLGAFQNCGKLGFSLASNGKNDSLLGLATSAQPARLDVSGPVPVPVGQDLSLTILAKNLVASQVDYVCATADDATVIAHEGSLTLTDGVAVLTIRVDQALSCVFTARAGGRAIEGAFAIPVE